MQFYFFPRRAADGNPAGFTVSKRSVLPDGDFRITEYSWGPTTLGFIDDDRFTADERQSAYHTFLTLAEGMNHGANS